MATAAVLIIGNEILSGKFRDENSPWLATRLRQLGVDLVRIETIPDEVDIIADAVRRLRACADWVFTSGGVGPTHDDVTIEGVAAGLGVDVVHHPDLDRVLKEKMGARYTPAAARMALVPEGAGLWWDGPFGFPQVHAQCVVIFPGVPALLRTKFDSIAHRLKGEVMLHRRLCTTRGESDIADALRALQGHFPQVQVGSYPRFEERPWTVIVTLDSRDADALDRCHAALHDILAPELVEMSTE